jgi:glycosyltransferase involved in cell wall biosynthesis
MVVIACAGGNDSAVKDLLLGFGVRYFRLPLDRSGLNPFRDGRYCNALVRLIGEEKPRVILAYTHKPVLYSALAIGFCRPKPRVFVMITGLGFAFMDGGGLKKRIAGTVLRALYRRASKHFAGVIFQNPDDQVLFRGLHLVRSETPQIVVRGSGIDLDEFAFAPLGSRGTAEPPNDEAPAGIDGHKPETLRGTGVHQFSGFGSQALGLESPVSSLTSRLSPLRFLLIARLLGDKGIREYVAAARIIKAQLPMAEFHLVGSVDPNPAAIKLSEVEGWHAEGVLVYHGSQRDVRPLLRDCTVYVLPSYREGTPRTVLEAMATGRPVITTDAPGCRETIFDAGAPDADGVRQGRNGFLVPVKSVDALVAAMRRFIAEPDLARRMGEEGRRLAEKYYDVHKVNEQILEFMGLAGPPSPHV